MAYHYFYAPCYHGPVPDADTGEPTSDTVKSPGIDTGSGTAYSPQFPPGSMALKYDDAETRCVVRTLHRTPQPGWVEKTSAEVLTDYPGLWGVL